MLLEDASFTGLTYQNGMTVSGLLLFGIKNAALFCPKRVTLPIITQESDIDPSFAMTTVVDMGGKKMLLLLMAHLDHTAFVGLTCTFKF